MDSSKNSETYHSPEIAFIIGMGRSGTTLLTNMLNSHSQIVSTPENEFVLFLKPHFQQKNFTDHNVVQEFVNCLQLKYSKTISFWKPTEELYKSILSLPDQNKNYAEVCKLVYLHYPFLNKKETIKWIVDKNPVYSMSCKELKELFPKCKFIIITRDYRDNIVSRKKYADKGSSMYSLAASWNYFYAEIEQSKLKNQADFLEIRYEDLVEKPHFELTQLCEFLSLDYEDSMLNFQDLSKQIKTHFKKTANPNDFEKISTMHGNLEKEVTTDRVQAFTSFLSPNEIQLIDYFCFKTGQKYNYLPHTKIQIRVSLLDKIKYVSALFKMKMYYSLKPIFNRLPLALKVKNK